MESTAEGKKTPSSAPTNSSQHLTSPWRRTDAFFDKVPTASRGLQSASWRQLDTTTVSSSPDTPKQFWSSPWNKTEFNSPSDYSSSPWGQPNINSPNKAYTPPWTGSNMSKGLSTTFHGESRPRLHLTIPNQSAGGGTVEKPPANLAQGNTRVVSGEAVDASEPQHPTRASTAIPPGSESPATRKGVQSPAKRRPHIFNAKATEFLHREMSSPEEVDGFVIGPRLLPRTENSSGGAAPSRAEVSALANPIEDLPPYTIPLRHADRSSLAETETNDQPVQNLIRQGPATYADLANRPAQTQYPKGPRAMGGRIHHTNAQAGGPSRLFIPNQPRAAASHTNSKTWVNPKTKLQERWAEVYKNLKEMSLIKEYRSGGSTAPPPIGGSFCVPTTFNEWTDHRLEFANDRTKEAKRKLARMEHQYQIPRHRDLPPAGPTAPMIVSPFAAKKFLDGCSAVLCMATIWTTWKPLQAQGDGTWPQRERPREERPVEERPEAMWPTDEEMREEGNERMTSGFRRFPPLPRVPGNPTVNWKQKKALPQLPFDEIWKLPSAETFNAQRERTTSDETTMMEGLIGRDLSSLITWMSEEN